MGEDARRKESDARPLADYKVCRASENVRWRYAEHQLWSGINVAVDLARLHHDVVRAVAAASTAPVGWNAVLRAVAATGHAVPDAIGTRDIADDVEDIVSQLTEIRAKEPPPDDLSFF